MLQDAHKIEVLVMEESSAARSSIVNLLNSDSRFVVVGMASSGRKVLQFLSKRQPDILIMDIATSELDGLNAARRIMESRPMPIVICKDSGAIGSSMAASELMEAGAVACVERPPLRNHKDFVAFSDQLLQTVKLMSEVKTVHRWPRSRQAKENPLAAPMFCGTPTNVQIIGIGASTGGPPVLKTIFEKLPKDFPVPLLVVQHIARGFLDGLAHWLSKAADINVHVAQNEAMPLPGHVYLAPDDLHMSIGKDRQIVLSDEAPDGGLRPSVARLFQSLADFCGPSAVGVLLTGMGKDGAKELKLMKDCGAKTIVQDRATSIIFGMPGQAVAIGAADQILPAGEIASALVSLVNQQQSFIEGASS